MNNLIFNRPHRQEPRAQRCCRDFTPSRQDGTCIQGPKLFESISRQQTLGASYGQGVYPWRTPQRLLEQA